MGQSAVLGAVMCSDLQKLTGFLNSDRSHQRAHVHFTELHKPFNHLPGFERDSNEMARNYL